jgi:PAS domain S-box-containing protein
MAEQLTESAEEIKRLQRCINDLVGVVALPAMWSGAEPSRIVNTLLDALSGMLQLDLVYLRLKDEGRQAPIEMFRLAQSQKSVAGPQEIGEILQPWFGVEAHQWPQPLRKRLGDREISIVPMGLGLQGEIGLIAAGSERADFPRQTERLILNVAANQASVALQEARLRSEQQRVASELDRRVAQRTTELAAANEELQLQAGLLQRLPVSAWTLKPDGTPDFVNQVWLEFSGQTLDFVRSHPEAWMTAVHPEDREAASRALWEGIRSGQGFAFETRSLRARDRTYRWHLQQAVVLRDAEGKVLKFVGTTTDIDDQKRAEEKLRESEYESRLIVDTIPAQISVAGSGGGLERASQRTLDYYGRSTEEFSQWATDDTIHPDDRPRYVQAIRHSLSTGDSTEIEVRTRRFDGVYRWFQIRGVPLRDHRGQILRWYFLQTDIDDRKRAEDDLRSSEAKYRVVVETASDAVVSMDERGVIIFANAGTKRIFGHEPAELIGKPLTVLMPEMMHRAHENGFKRYLATGHRHINWQGTELTALRGNGQEFPVEVSFGELIRDGHKVFTGFIRDISERKRAEEALRESEQNLRSIVDSIPGMLMLVTPTGQLEAANPQLTEYTGKTLEELQNWTTSDVVHPDDRSRVVQVFAKMIAAGIPYDFEARIRRHDGVYRWFYVRVVPQRGANGQIIRWCALHSDIDERKHAEDKLRASERSLRELTETIPQMLWSAEADGTIDYCNRRALEYIGLNAEGVSGAVWAKPIHPDDIERMVQAWTAAVSTGEPFQCEFRLRRAADQSYRLCYSSALPLRDQKGEVIKWFGSVVDLHDWKEAQKALQTTQAELARVSRLTTMGELAASIAHEINQPLTAVITNGNACLRLLASRNLEPEVLRRALEGIIADGTRASAVLARIRAFIKKEPAERSNLDINEVIREVLILAGSELHENQVLLDHQLATDLPLVLADRVQLQQVLLNLIMNGIEAMAAVTNRPRSLAVKSRIDDSGDVLVAVSDSGTGFVSDVDRVFTAFFTTKVNGMGMGLAISRSLVESHGGRLWAIPNSPYGAVFSFTLPATGGSPS